jgi:flagellar protein FliL
MSDPQPDAPKKGRGLLITLLAVSIALTAGGAAAFTQRAKIETLVGMTPADSTAVPEPEPVEFGAFTELEGIVINPRGTGGRRYLMAKLGVEAEDEETLDRMGELGPASLDAVLTVLGSQTVDQLSDISRRDSLKGAIRDALNGVLGDDGPVTRVYFTQYVLQ